MQHLKVEYSNDPPHATTPPICCNYVTSVKSKEDVVVFQAALGFPSWASKVVSKAAGLNQLNALVAQMSRSVAASPHAGDTLAYQPIRGLVTSQALASHYH